MSCRAPSELARRQGASSEQVGTFDRDATKLAGKGAGAHRVSQPIASAEPLIPTQKPADTVREGISTVSQGLFRDTRRAQRMKPSSVSYAS